MHFQQKVSQIVRKYPQVLAVLTIVIIAMLAYLPGITGLGYYRDDWHVTWGGTLIGALKIIDLHLTDRPLMGVVYAAAFQFLGNDVLVWHMYVFILRVLGGIAVYYLLGCIWKKQTTLIALMASLFVVYPGFLQMPTSSAYSNHLLGLLCGLLAILFTIKAYESSNKLVRVLLLLFSMPMILVCFGFMEWMMGIEGFLVLFLAVRISQDVSFQWKWLWFGRVFWWSLHSFVVFGGFFIWRIFFFTSARSVTDVKSLGQSYLLHSGEMLFRLIIEPIRGFLNSMVFAWGVPFYQLSSNVSMKTFAISLIISLLGAVVFLGLHFLPPASNTDEKEQGQRNDLKQMLLLGAVFIFLAILPVIIANREVRLTDTFDRYTLLASLGVVMVVVAGFKLLFGYRQFAAASMVLLVLSMMTQLLNTQSFAEFWKAERALWWQLSWRAPELKEDTVILPVMPDDYALAESYEIWGPANLIYSSGNPLAIAGEVINQQTIPWIHARGHYIKTIRRVDVSIDFNNSLLVSLPSTDRCLHVYGKENRIVSNSDDAIVSYLAAYSSLQQILPDGDQASVPAQIFGEEPVHGWCYTYQKASLAYQNQAWEDVARLGDEAFLNGMEPIDMMEYIPFYEAYAQLGRYEDANRIGERIRLDKYVADQYCDLHASNVDELDDNTYFMVTNICTHFVNE